LEINPLQALREKLNNYKTMEIIFDIKITSLPAKGAQLFFKKNIDNQHNDLADIMEIMEIKSL